MLNSTPIYAELQIYGIHSSIYLMFYYKNVTIFKAISCPVISSSSKSLDKVALTRDKGGHSYNSSGSLGLKTDGTDT